MLCCYFALHSDLHSYFLKLGGFSVTEADTKVHIATQKNGEWWKCELADCLYSVAIQVNSFYNKMVDKMVWHINWGRINKYSLYSVHPHYIQY